MSSNNRQQKQVIRFGRGKAGNAVQPCGTWIEIELEDLQGNPVPFEKYCITGPGGDQRYGTPGACPRIDCSTAEKLNWPLLAHFFVI